MCGVASREQMLASEAPAIGKTSISGLDQTALTPGPMPGPAKYAVIELSMSDRHGLLSDVTALLAKQHLSVISAATWSQHTRAAMVLFVEVCAPWTLGVKLPTELAPCTALSLSGLGVGQRHLTVERTCRPKRAVMAAHERPPSQRGCGPPPLQEETRLMLHPHHGTVEQTLRCLLRWLLSTRLNR